MSRKGWQTRFFLILILLSVSLRSISGATTDTVELWQAERALTRVCDRATTTTLDDHTPLAKEIVSAFAEKLAGPPRRRTADQLAGHRGASQGRRPVSFRPPPSPRVVSALVRPHCAGAPRLP